MSVADFVEDRKEGERNTWNTAKSKMYEFVRRGVGSKECVTDEQMETLRKFTQTGITAEKVKSKSSAAANLVVYLLAVHNLQEHLFILAQTPEVLAEADPEQFAGANRAASGSRRDDLHDLYYARQTTGARGGGAAGGPGQKRKRSAGRPSKKRSQ